MDPNPDMLRNLADKQGRAIQAAWVEGFEDPDVGYIPSFRELYPDERFDVVNMAFVRQFVTTDTDAWYGEVRDYLKPDGVFLYSAKVAPEPGKLEEWRQREAVKDQYKRLTYTKEEMAAKSAEVLEGMNHLLLPYSAEMGALRSHFRYVEPIWTGEYQGQPTNFHGWVAGNNEDAVRRFTELYAKLKAERSYAMPQPKPLKALPPWGFDLPLKEFLPRPTVWLSGWVWVQEGDEWRPAQPYPFEELPEHIRKRYRLYLKNGWAPKEDTPEAWREAWEKFRRENWSPF